MTVTDLDDHPHAQLRAASEQLRDGNTWVGRGLVVPLADLLDAVADQVAEVPPAGAASTPLALRALTVAAVVTGHSG